LKAIKEYNYSFNRDVINISAQLGNPFMMLFEAVHKLNAAFRRSIYYARAVDRFQQTSLKKKIEIRIDGAEVKVRLVDDLGLTGTSCTNFEDLRDYYIAASSSIHLPSGRDAEPYPTGSPSLNQSSAQRYHKIES
jgi:hypothetical protein